MYDICVLSIIKTNLQILNVILLSFIVLMLTIKKKILRGEKDEKFKSYPTIHTLKVGNIKMFDFIKGINGQRKFKFHPWILNIGKHSYVRDVVI